MALLGGGGVFLTGGGNHLVGGITAPSDIDIDPECDGAGTFTPGLSLGLVVPPALVGPGGYRTAILVGAGSWLVLTGPGRLKRLVNAHGADQTVTVYDHTGTASGTTILDETLAAKSALNLQMPVALGIVVVTSGSGTVLANY